MLFAGGVLAQPPQPVTGTPTDEGMLAQRLVNQCANIAQGELVLIAGSPRDLELLQHLAIAVRQRGAHPLLTLQTEDLTRRMFTEVPAQYDAQERVFGTKLARMIDAYIAVDYGEDPNLLADIATARVQSADQANMKVECILVERGVRQLMVGNGLYPTKARAQQFGIPQRDLSRIFWDAVNVDYGQLQARGEEVRTRLAATKELEITAANGTKLTVRIADRRVHINDGVISTQDRQPNNPNCQAWLPAGEVYVTPVPGTANGTFVVEHCFFEGEQIDNLKLEFRNGRLTSMTAQGEMKQLKRRYDGAAEGRDLLAVIDLGINTNVRVPRDSRLVTYMAAGTITIGVGNNSWAGGDNDVPFWLPAHLTNGTLKTDGQVLIDRGQLKTKDIH
jgi:leucyl aminopeptidase (aminopeptidase T)